MDDHHSSHDAVNVLKLMMTLVIRSLSTRAPIKECLLSARVSPQLLVPAAAGSAFR